MAKYAPDSMIDASLDYVAGSDYLCVCSGSPTTFAAAYVDNMLAKVGVDAGDFTKGDDTSGRKLTVGAQTAFPITGNGTAEACGLGPIATMCLVCQALGAGTTEEISYATSGEVTKDTRSVEGYAAIAVI